jgi:hypothetical protein
MRRFAIASLAVPLMLLLAVGPVAADTTPGGSGTNFASFSTTCSNSGGRQVCTDTNLQVFPDESGTPQTCLDLQTYSISSTGRFTFISDQFGCAPTGSNLTVGSDLSVTLASSTISMQSCAAHKRQCSGSTNATVSASDSVVGDVSVTTTRSTTVSGNCTIKTTSTDTSASLTGTITINGSSADEQGFVDIFKVTQTIRCK